MLSFRRFLRRLILNFRHTESNSESDRMVSSTISPAEPDTFYTADIRPSSKPQLENDKVFSLSDTNPADFPIGLTYIDIGRSANIRITAYTDSVTQDSVKVHLDSWEDTVLYSAGCTWLGGYAEDCGIQFGHFSTTDDHPRDKPKPQTSRKITFSKPFNGSPPKVIVWLNELNMSNKTNWRCKAYTSDITADSFIVHIDTWADTTLYSASVSWIAHPANSPKIASGSFNTMDVRPWFIPLSKNKGTAKFDVKFKSIPRVVVALDWLDIGNRGNLRLRLAKSNVSTEGLMWNIDAWGDTILYSAGASYIALLDI